MGLTVYGAMKLGALKNFTLAAGHLGLDRKVCRTGILDYEFTGKVPDEIANQFAPGEFILSSMLYAHQDEDALLQAVQKLIDLKVAALAIKTIFFKALPERVCRLANAERFPIFLFDNSVFFEDVIAEISESVKTSDRLRQLEFRLDTLMYRDMSREELRSIALELNPGFLKHVAVFYGKPGDASVLLSAERIHDAYMRNRYRGDENLLTGYKDGIMLFLTAESAEPSVFEARLDDVLLHCGLSREKLNIGCSGVYDVVEELNQAVREAVWAQMVSAVSPGRMVSFEKSGVYQMLLPHRDSRWSEAYHKKVLSPLLRQDAVAGTELMKTAIAYIRCAGGIKKTAEILFVHENTVRYRINNIHRMLCPEANELAFYEQLSLAIRLYVLKNKDSCI